MRIIFSFFTVLTLIYLSLQQNKNTCNEKDIQYKFGECNVDGLHKVIFYTNDNCDNSNFTLPMYIDNMDCSKTCQAGSYLDFDIKRSIQVCSPCPENTYSTGGALRILGKYQEWNNESFNYFDNDCFINDGIDSISNCTAFSISKDQSYIYSGKSFQTNVNYNADLSFGVNLVRDGYIEFKYKKSSVKEYYYTNGLMRFFINYKLEIRDFEVTDEWKTYRQSLQKGFNTFLIQYAKFIDDAGNSDDMNMKIDYIIVDGIRNADRECKKCINSFSTQGSDTCNFCKENNYLNEATHICEKCPENTYSFPFSVGVENCYPKLPCSLDDLIPILGDCVNNTRTLSYVYPELMYCDNKTSNISLNTQLSCDKCQPGTFFNSKANGQYSCDICPKGSFSDSNTLLKDNTQCTKCMNNYISSNIYNVTSFLNVGDMISTSCKSENSKNCEKIKGFQKKYDKLISGTYLPGNVQLEMTIKFSIIEPEGMINFKFNIQNILDQDNVAISINNKKNESYTQNGNYSKSIQLDKGEYVISIVLFRGPKRNEKNIFSLYSILITGSNLGGSYTCKECPHGYINSKGKNTCDPCPNGYTSDNDKNQCIRCPGGLVNDKHNIGKCYSCPNFTVPSISYDSCAVLDVLHNKNYLLKIYTDDLKGEIHNNCNDDLEICYGKFIGPIKGSSNNSFYFASVFEPDHINITDFTYSVDKDDSTFGHFFALFPETKPSVQFKNDDSQTFSNLKRLKNLGQRIESIKLYNTIVQGYVIEYFQGSTCINDPTKKYKTYLFVSCDKNDEDLFPKFLGNELNNGCTQVFEWKTRYACRNCIKEESAYKMSACQNGVKNVFYEETDMCIIRNGSNTERQGWNITFNDESNLLNYSQISEDEVLKFYFNNKRNLYKSNKLSIPSVNLTLPDEYYYVSNNLMEETCNYTDDLKSEALIIIICIPVVYFLTMIILIFMYCKYRKITTQYTRLKEEKENSKEFKDKNLQIEFQENIDKNSKV